MDAANECMNLDEAQRKKVAAWIAEGLKLSEIQNRLATELGIRMTYMDVRFLVDDLKLTPKDVDRPKLAAPVLPVAEAPKPADSKGLTAEQPAASPAASGTVSVSVDALARPGAVVSGKAKFSDGKMAD